MSNKELRTAEMKKPFRNSIFLVRYSAVQKSWMIARRNRTSRAALGGGLQKGVNHLAEDYTKGGNHDETPATVLPYRFQRPALAYGRLHELHLRKSRD
jgi:hypothetical protein